MSRDERAVSDADRPAGSGGPAASSVDRTTARYLFAVAVLSGDHGGRVPTGALADYLGVAPASSTEMAGKLDDSGLLDYEPYDGVALSDRGESLADRLTWRCCVVSTFFESVLDAAVDDHTALDIGYTLPRNAVFRVDALTESPCRSVCPEAGRDAECRVA